MADDVDAVHVLRRRAVEDEVLQVAAEEVADVHEDVVGLQALQDGGISEGAGDEGDEPDVEAGA